MEISYKATFIRQFNKLDKDLQEEVFEKIDFFKDKNNHTILKVHKLHGKLKDCYSFYVNYKIRIVFIWATENEATLLAIGSHDIYK
jgi:mRNA-degrading endonuclease YafQ of YafQ-DinJ toxin-antitoxin module